MSAGRLTARLIQLLVAVALATVGFAAPAQACDADSQHAFGFSPGCFDMRIAGSPTAGDRAPAFFQAGGHPYEVTTAVRLNAPAEDDPVHGVYWTSEALKSLRLSLPSGLVANPTAVPPCRMDQLALSLPTCPPDSQVGVMTLHFPSPLGPVLISIDSPVYRVASAPGAPPRFGFSSNGAPGLLEAKGGAGGLGNLAIDLEDIGAGVSLAGMTVALWGVPADPAHTPMRACPGVSPPGSQIFGPGPSCPATLPEQAFLRLPTSCTGPAAVTARVDSWQDPGDFSTETTLTHQPPGLLGDPTAGSGYPAAYPGLPSDQWGAATGFSGCERVPFEPSLTVDLDNHAAETPTGLDLEVSLPQRGIDDPSAVAESDLRGAVIEMPAGLSLNPSVANGLSTCTAAQVGLGSSSEPACPDSSKLGTVEISSPLLEGSLKGFIYNAAQDTPGSTEIPAYIVAGSKALWLKLRSGLRIDQATGKVSASFEGSPQVPIGSLRMRFFGGDRAPFVSPSACGRYTSEGRFTPWSGTGPVSVGDSFEITSGLGGGPCNAAGDRPFEPGFKAGVTSAVAGASSVLSVEVSRRDGEQAPNSLEMSLPGGLAASLRAVSTCPDATIASLAGRSGNAELAAPSCPPGSRVGVAQATMGAGSAPLTLDGGRIYLAGPYQGSARSFVVVLPAVAGPLDLNTLALRLPLQLGSSDGRLRFKATFPTVQNGVALNLRRIRMDIDRPGFVSNPTNCQAKSIDARIGGDGGAVADVSVPFQIVGCSSLGFDPRLGMSLMGGRSASRHQAHPAIKAVLRAGPGNANLKSAKIVFPSSEQLDPTHIRGICRRPEFAADKCPEASIYGHAKVLSPILGEPLQGPVYLRNSKRKLPDIVASVHGQLDLDLPAKIGFSDGRLMIAMDDLPDLPVSKLVLTMAGGKKGVFVNNRDLCEAPSFSTAEMVAQNGKAVRRTTRLDAPC